MNSNIKEPESDDPGSLRHHPKGKLSRIGSLRKCAAGSLQRVANSALQLSKTCAAAVRRENGAKQTTTPSGIALIQ